MSRVGLAVGCSGGYPVEETLLGRHRFQARDVMISNPKTLPADATVDDARGALADDRVHMVLLVDGETLCGTLMRPDLVLAPVGENPALAFAVLRGRTVRPETPLDRIQQLLHRHGMRRLAVIDADRTLRGLVCLKRSRSGFCSDTDVASRAAAAVANTDEGTT